MNVGAQPTNSYCCEGVQVNNQTPISFHYTIMPMQTDLYPGPQSRFYTQGDATYQKYWWENISEYSSGNNLNTFQVEIKPTGYIGIKYDQVNIQNQFVTSAVIGDASRGEYSLHYYGRGMTASSVPSLIEYGSTGSICTSNPLADPACPGYAEAYFNQQCSANPLYAATCPGYQQAYYTQQCSINPLYDSGCPGYAGAYFSQQCTANPLYDSLCPGYQQAYFNQQCENDGLYSQQCPNYAAAYAKKILFEQQGIATTVSTSGGTVNNDTNHTTTSTTPTSGSTTQPETTSATSTTSVSPAAVISVIRPAEPIATSQQQNQQPQSQPPQEQAQKQQEERKTENQVANKIEKSVGGGDGAKGDKQKMKDAVAKVQKEIAKESQEAKTIEAQVATQGLVVGSMNFVPGFDAYKNALIPDTNALLMARQYQKPVVDNQRVQRRLSGANELRWQQMVDSQYQIGK
jgi:hypothetical protein